MYTVHEILNDIESKQTKKRNKNTTLDRALFHPVTYVNISLYYNNYPNDYASFQRSKNSIFHTKFTNHESQYFQSNY